MTKRFAARALALLLIPLLALQPAFSRVSAAAEEQTFLGEGELGLPPIVSAKDMLIPPCQPEEEGNPDEQNLPDGCGAPAEAEPGSEDGTEAGEGADTSGDAKPEGAPPEGEAPSGGTPGQPLHSEEEKKDDTKQAGETSGGEGDSPGEPLDGLILITLVSLITAFEPLEEGEASREVPPGTARETLGLPESLAAKLDDGEEPTAGQGETEAEKGVAQPEGAGIPAGEDGDEGVEESVQPVAVPVESWTAEPPYDPDAPGIYVFRPVFAEGVLCAEGVEPPEITVSVLAETVEAVGMMGAMGILSVPDVEVKGTELIFNNVAAGQWGAAIVANVADPSQITKLTAVGQDANNSDIIYITTHLPGLVELDISGGGGNISFSDSQFSGNTKVENINLSGNTGLRGIFQNAFKDCSNLLSVNLSGCSNLLGIDSYAFRNCGNLLSVNLSGCDSLTSIRGSAFEGCINLQALDLSEITRRVGIFANPFSGLTGVRVYVPQSFLDDYYQDASWRALIDTGIVVLSEAYTVTVSVTPTNSGSVAIDRTSPGAPQVKLTATPNTGYSDDVVWDIDAGNGTYETRNGSSIDYTLVGNASITAQFPPQTYDVTYMTNGGTLSSPPLGVDWAHYTFGVGLTLPEASDVTRNGYAFGGWYDSADATETIITLITAADFGDKTIIAKWALGNYTVTYDFDGGTSASSAPTQVNYTFGDNVVFPTDLTRNGHTFGGWYDSADPLKTTITQITTADFGDKTIVAKWIPIYTVTYNLNGGTLPSPPLGVDWGHYTYGVGLTLPTPTLYGSYFIGWCGDVSLTLPSITKITDTDSGDKTFWASWNPGLYTINYFTNGGASPSLPSSLQEFYSYGNSRSYPTDMTRPGYTFDGWYEDPGFAGSPVTGVLSTFAGNINVYAKWIPNVYTITYNLNGGTQQSGSFSSYTVGVGLTLPPKPTRSGYTFAGWYANSALTGSAVTQITAIDTGDKTFYAKWNANTGSGSTGGGSTGSGGTGGGSTGGASSASGSTGRPSASTSSASRPAGPTVITVTNAGTLENGRLLFLITAGMAQEGIDKAQAQAKQRGTLSSGFALIFRLTSGEAFTAQTIGIEKEALALLRTSGTLLYIEVITDIFCFQLDAEAIRSLESGAKGPIYFDADPASFSGPAAEAIGDRPAFEAQAYYYGEGDMGSERQPMTELNKGKITYRIAYRPEPGEAQTRVGAVLVGADGAPAWVDASQLSEGFVSWADTLLHVLCGVSLR